MSDKRSVATDALETLGTIIQGGGRDAIHLAVEPTVAKETLRPGQSIGVDGSSDLPWVGIVDPFLRAPVQPGQMFWLVVYPRQINSLRHVWTHPAFKDAPQPVVSDQKLRSEGWLRQFLESRDAGDEEDFDNVMSAVDYHEGNGEYLHVGQTVINGEIPSEFWDHVEILTGKKIANRASYFSCSC